MSAETSSLNPDGGWLDEFETPFYFNSKALLETEALLS
jgi:hypothetical protein